MKDTLIKINNNCSVDEAENQINDLKHKEPKKSIRTTRRKKNIPS